MNDCKRWLLSLSVLAAALSPLHLAAERMEEEWGEQVVKAADAVDDEEFSPFRDGNYAMFIHWGLYSQLANQYKGKTYYGIGEWLMNRRMANIPFEEYRELTKDFNPTAFDPKAIAQLAKDAGMKYVVITAKHHDGFAMFDTDAHWFNIVDQTPFARDPMRELAEACREVGIGFGFYYSHHKDWTAPGAGAGPTHHTDGREASYDDYFYSKALPQVTELATNYGPLDLFWFDTPGDIQLKYAEKLLEVVRTNQPKAMVNSRLGHGLGDYQSLGDMEVPRGNVPGLWETVDTTNDSWGYAWYDDNWKTPHTILSRLISTVGRGGTYMLNIGPRGDGSVPAEAEKALRVSGEWIQRYPFVVYGAEASPWGHVLPWGDITVQGDRLYLSIFNMPKDGVLHLPGLKTAVRSAKLLHPENASAKKGGFLSRLFASGSAKRDTPLAHEVVNGWTRIELPDAIAESLIPVVEVQLVAPPVVDGTKGLDPSVETTLLAEFAKVEGARVAGQRWMEKFGEWKHVYRAFEWTPEGRAFWEVEVLEPGYYQVDLTYAGEGRIAWRVGIEGGSFVQNQQNASHVYKPYPIGWLEFPEPGRYTVYVSCVDGDLEQASLKAAHFQKINF